MLIFTGNANPVLAGKVARFLNIPLGKATVGSFSDGEIMVEILEHVRGRDVFIIQPTCAPSNDNLMELLVMTDALRRASANTITAVIPYFGYSRQDRKPRSARMPISAKLVAKMIVSAGIHRILTVDLHADQIQGFFSIGVDNVYASPILLGDIWRHKYSNPTIVSPDVGGVIRARALSKRVEGSGLAIIDKRRPKANVAKVMHVIGDVEGRTCIMIDDMVDTAGTLCAASKSLKEHGAAKVYAYCTHPVLSGKAIDNINHSMIDELVVTDTIPLGEEAMACPRIRVLSLAEMLAETIRRIHNNESVSSMYID